MAVPLFRAPALLVFQILRIGRLSFWLRGNEPPGRNPDTVIFHRVHSAVEEVSAVYDPVTKHFILAASDEQEYTRTVVFAVFTLWYEFVGACRACHWTRVTKVWTLTCLAVIRVKFTTTNVSGTTGCRFIMVTTLPAMSNVKAFTFSRRFSCQPL